MEIPHTTFETSLAAPAVVLTPIDRIDHEGTPWVCLQGRHISALTTTTIDSSELVRAVQQSSTAVVALVDEGRRAVILGFLVSSPSAMRTVPAQDADVAVDGQTITVAGHDEVVLRCGKASITLTKAGKILIRGEYVSSRASGVNTVKGGAVHIN